MAYGAIRVKFGLKEQTGSWTTVFILVVCLDALNHARGDHFAQENAAASLRRNLGCLS